LFADGRIGRHRSPRPLHERIEARTKRFLSAATVLEAAIVLESRSGELAGRELDLFLHRARVKVVPVDEEQVEISRTGVHGAIND
jgi:ribonuclease VapC